MAVRAEPPFIPPLGAAVRACGLVFALCAAMQWATPPATGADKSQPTTKAELTAIRKQLAEAGELARKNRVSEATRLVDEAEQKLDGLVASGALADETDAVEKIKKTIAQRRKVLASRTEGGGKPAGQGRGVSFTKQVLPILNKHCTGCHASDSPKGGLKLDSFENLKAGGGNGAAIIGGQADKSSLVVRLSATGDERMPKGKPALARRDVETITRWINDGARPDAEEQGTTSKVEPKMPAGKVEIATATPSDNVSFTRDIAPFLVNICLGCHSGEMPRGGLSMETFEKLMQGGKSGRVLIAGDTNKSRLFRLAGGLELPRMPANDARITRKNYEDLKTWIEEGVRFDGKDPAAPLRSLVPSADDLKSRELAGMSAEQLAARRASQLRDLWKRVITKAEPQVVERAEFIVLGKGDAARLTQVAEQAEAMLAELRKTFGDPAQPAWKGKLGIFVMSDRFSYEEFQLVIQKRRVPREIVGHAVVTKSGDQAYVVIQDEGDQSTADTPGTLLNLRTQIARAYLSRWGEFAPEWLAGGTALAAAATGQQQNPYVQTLNRTLPEHVAAAGSVEGLIDQKNMAPTASASVNLGLVNTLISGGMPKFLRLWSVVREGQTPQDALTSVYGIKQADVAQMLVGRVRK